MPFIQWTEDDRATGLVAEVYSAWKQSHPGRARMPEILKCFSGEPSFLKAIVDVSSALHFTDGHLTRRQKEMIATLVSGLNGCLY